MDRLRQLIHEIHRRSVWQVLLIYLGGSVAVLGGAGTLSDVLRLPDWFVPLAFALLIVGLPIVLATAFVQGISGSEAERTASSDEAPAASGVLTWRNALGGGVLAFALLGVVGAAWVFLIGGELRTGERASAIERSVAVLPFVNMSGNPDNEYFSDGITEELLNALAQLPDLRVPGRTSSFAMKDQELTIREIADTLRVGHILEGSVRRDSDRVLITAQLIDALTDTHLWSETFERDLSDIFALQREIAAAIARELQLALTGEQRESLVEDATRNPEAYDLYLRAKAAYSGRGTSGVRTESIDSALLLYAQAVAADPGFSLAHAGAAEAWAQRPQYGGDAITDVAFAEAEARTALALDETLALPRLVLGNVARNRREWEQAEAMYEDALEHLPNYSEAHHEYGEFLARVNRCEEATAAQRSALEHDPLSGIFRSYLAYALVCMGRIEEALGLVEDFLTAMRARRVVVAGGNPTGNFAIFALLEDSRVEEAVATARLVGNEWRLAVAEGVRDGISDAAQLGISVPRAGAAVWGMALLGDEEATLQAVETCLEASCLDLQWLWMPAVRRLVGQHPRYRSAMTAMEVAQ